jgi:hypothetical protein
MKIVPRMSSSSPLSSESQHIFLLSRRVERDVAIDPPIGIHPIGLLYGEILRIYIYIIARELSTQLPKNCSLHTAFLA